MFAIANKTNSRFSRNGILLFGGRGFNPKSLYLDGALGTLLAPGDFSTQFTTSGGSTNITGVGQAEGRAEAVAGGVNVIQATADNRPQSAQVPRGDFLAGGLPYAGFLDGASGHYFSTPDSAALDITGDIQLDVDIAAIDYTPSANDRFLSKRSGVGQASYECGISTTGALQLIWSPDGTTLISKTSTALLSSFVADGARVKLQHTLDVNNGAFGNNVEFRYSVDGGENYTQLGSTVTTAGATSINASSSPLELGSVVGGGANQFEGKVYSAQVYNNIGGTLVADFTPNAYTGNGASTFVSSTTGETWTINGHSSGAFIGSASLVRTSAANITIPNLPSIPGFYFDGTNDLFNGTFSSTDFQTTGACVAGWIQVYNADPSADAYYAGLYGSNATAHFALAVQTSNNKIALKFQNDAGGGVITVEGPVITFGLHYYQMYFNASGGLVLWFDGVQYTGSMTPGAITLESFAMGGFDPNDTPSNWSNEVQDSFWFDYPPSAPQVAQINSYLANVTGV